MNEPKNQLMEVGRSGKEGAVHRHLELTLDVYGWLDESYRLHRVTKLSIGER